jgi:hypothetical protein
LFFHSFFFVIRFFSLFWVFVLFLGLCLCSFFWSSGIFSSSLCLLSLVSPLVFCYFFPPSFFRPHFGVAILWLMKPENAMRW